MPPNTAKVDRATCWGNPFHRNGDGVPMDRHLAVVLFRALIEKEGMYLARAKGQGTYSITVDHIRNALAGKNLACWCPLDQPCHADVLLELATS